MTGLALPFASLLPDALLRNGFGYVLLLLVAMTRLSIMALVVPVFTRSGLTGMRRLAVALALSLPVALHLVPAFGQLLQTDAGTLSLLVGKEAIIGLLLGLGFGVPFWAVESAGDVLDMQRGSAIAYMTDPTLTSDVSISGTFLELVLVALFYAGGGPDMLLGALYDSYRLWPVFAPLPAMNAGNAGLALDLLDQVMRLALLLGGPLFVVLFLVDATMALVARISPQIHAFYLTLPVKAIALFAVLPVYVVFFVHHADQALGAGHGVLTQLGQILK